MLKHNLLGSISLELIPAYHFQSDKVLKPDGFCIRRVIRKPNKHITRVVINMDIAAPI